MQAESCPNPFEKRKWVLSHLWHTKAHCLITDIPQKKQNANKQHHFALAYVQRQWDSNYAHGGRKGTAFFPSSAVAAVHNLSIEQTRTDPHPLLLLPGLWNLDFRPRLLLLLCPWCWDEEGRPQDCTCARQGLIPQSDLCFAFEYMWCICIHMCECVCGGACAHV